MNGRAFSRGVGAEEGFLHGRRYIWRKDRRGEARPGQPASTSVVDGFLKFFALAGGAMIGDYDELMNSDLNKITRACLLVSAQTYIHNYTVKIK